MTAWIVVTVVWKSRTSALIDTFITDWSSTITNCAEAKATSASEPLPAVALLTFLPSAPGGCPPSRPIPVTERPLVSHLADATVLEATLDILDNEELLPAESAWFYFTG